MSFEPGQYLWDDEAGDGAPRVIVSLSNQTRLSLSRRPAGGGDQHLERQPDKNPTPTGYFPIMEKKVMHHSRKYDNAPMPHMQRLDTYGIALHAGMNPGSSGVAWLHPPAGQVRGETVHRDQGRHAGDDRGVRLRSELAEALFEAVDVAAGEIVGLVDDLVARQAAAKCAERLVEIVDLRRRQFGDLVEARDAVAVEHGGELGADALELGQIVGRARGAGQRIVDARGNDRAGDVGSGGGGFVGRGPCPRRGFG